MKVYDCFAFFNEMELLQLRLRELNDVVDYFVLVEATRTFQKKEKPLYFEQNKERFREFLPKIRHIVVDEYPTFWTKFRPVTTWHYDNHQKEGVLKGLENAAPDDLIIFSDLDEIPLASKVREYKNKPGIRVFEQFQSYYFLNYVCTHINDYDGKAVAQRNFAGFGRWRGTVMLEKKLITTMKAVRNYRDAEGSHITVIPDSGWHFSYMGGLENVIYKIQSWTHQEYNNEKYNTKEKVLANIQAGRDLFDEGMKYELFDINTPKLPFPQELKDHPERWSSMLRTPEQLAQDVSELLK
ncbi:MAG: hypothetical protein ACK5P7_02030 [Bdellovibrio sp.]|jgi:beta-1,4-mannosyl-glycoprotein beta-1,4-N-acetylglucosaminyltransferase